MSNTAVKEKIATIKTKNHPLTEQNLSKSDIQEIFNKYSVKDIPDPLSVDYEEPIKYGNYMKLEEGENKFRILSEGIVGVEHWEIYEDEEGKEKKRPLRITEGGRIDLSQVILDGESKPKDFEAFFIYNYKAGKIQILNVTQKTITKGIRKFTKDRSWGSPINYDLVITKTVGNNPRYDTSYSVIAKPPFVLDSNIQKQWEQSGFTKNYLYLLFANLDPFSIREKMEREENTNSALIAIQPSQLKAEVAS
jgi:hypothetical protein